MTQLMKIKPSILVEFFWQYGEHNMMHSKLNFLVD